jgi:hypothetical protein
MILGSTLRLTEMSARNLPEGKGRAPREAGNLTAIREPTVLDVSQSYRTSQETPTGRNGLLRV